MALSLGKHLNKPLFVALFSILALFGCNSSDVGDAIDVATGIDPKPIKYSKLAVNCFANDGHFGSAVEQFSEVKSTLKLGAVRVLFNWDDSIQPTPSSPLNFAFMDYLISGIPANLDVLVVVSGLPSWMQDSANWVDGSPRETFIRNFFSPVVKHFGSKSPISAWQIWNEPNDAGKPDNTTLGLVTSPANYVEMLALGKSVIDQITPGKKLLNAATTSINQNFPDSIDYNRGMRDAGAQSFVDVWAIHYYGKQYENVIRDSGVADFLNGLSKPIWITESGERGYDKQLDYGQRTWPFLLDKIPGIERIYIYQFADSAPADSTYGLRNLTPGKEYSDLYTAIKNRT